MSTVDRVLRIFLTVFTGFLALTAIGGGIALVAGINSPPLESLTGSLFSSYLVPGLALMLVVGGSALAALILLLRGSAFAVLCAATAGIVIMFFEFVEVQVIGMPAGVGQFLQLFYFYLGTLITVVSFYLWMSEIRRLSQAP